MSKSSQAGFSLIELMISVSIISILATIAIPNFQAFVDKARYNRSKSEMSSMSTSLEGERVTEEKEYNQIILSAGYSAGCIACIEGRSVGADANVATNLNDPSVLFAWKLLGYDHVPMDPWDRPYFIDDNENEGGAGDCRHDMIFSAGKDHIIDCDSSGDDVAAGSDDAVFRVPFFNTSCESQAGVQPSGYDGY